MQLGNIVSLVKMSILVSIALMFTLIPLSAFGQSIITIGLSSTNYELGKPIMVQGTINLGPNDPKGLPISIELYDPNNNVIDARTLNVANSQFTYVIPTGEGTKVVGNGKFTIIAYYGNPNPLLLNTPQSTKVFFTITNATSTQGELITTVSQGQSSSQSSTQSSSSQPSFQNNTSNQSWIIIFVLLLIVFAGAAGATKKIRRPSYNHPASMKQLAFLRSVGYDGPMPTSSQEAWDIIADIKKGRNGRF